MQAFPVLKSLVAASFATAASVAEGFCDFSGYGIKNKAVNAAQPTLINLGLMDPVVVVPTYFQQASAFVGSAKDTVVNGVVDATNTTINGVVSAKDSVVGGVVGAKDMVVTVVQDNKAALLFTAAVVATFGGYKAYQKWAPKGSFTDLKNAAKGRAISTVDSLRSLIAKKDAASVDGDQ